MGEAAPIAPASAADAPRIEISGLVIRAGSRTVVDGVSLRLEPGRIVALVGASGSGKTLTARALIGMVPVKPGIVDGDLIIVTGGASFRPLRDERGVRRTPAERETIYRAVRGQIIGYLPQDARAALDPTWTVRSALFESHMKKGPDAPLFDALERVGFTDPARVLGLYPHELSGGMAQRVVIAQALLQGSRFLICDEPTTGLDAPVQADIVGQLADLAKTGVGLLMITHDLRLLPGFAHEVRFLDRGRLVETAHPSALVDDSLTSEPARRLVAATRRIAGGRLG